MIDPTVLIALASILGAGLFTGAGYVLGDRRSREWGTDGETAEDGEVVEDSAPGQEVTALTMDREIARKTTSPPADLSSSASFRTDAIAPLTTGSMQDLLLDLAEQTVSFRVALYDESGLLVESVGGTPDPAIGALVGLCAHCLYMLEETAVVREPPTLEIHDVDQGTVRLRAIQWQGQTFVLTTIGPHRNRSSPTEDAVSDAIPTLLAS